MTSRLVDVAVPVPGLDLLTYLVPAAFPSPDIGARVIVPLGSRQVTGVAVRHSGASPADGDRVVPASDLKPITRILDDHAFLPPSVVTLALWVADYYACGPGEALAAVLPPRSRHARANAHRTIRVTALTAEGRGADPATFRAKQRLALEVLQSMPAGVPLAALRDRGVSAAVLGRMARRQLLTLGSAIQERDPFGDELIDLAPDAGALANGTRRVLTDEQSGALARLSQLAAEQRFAAVVLQGVTGSGKTEIYLRLAEQVVDARRRVMILVPEIALTPALTTIFRVSFGDRVAVQHSGLSSGERHDQWHRIRRGEIDVVIGTRSAVFAPVERLGLIVVDEEHDSSYKQEESPRYHGRDVAVMRAKREDSLVVLGSATPSLESAYNVRQGRYERLVLERRVLDRPLASVQVVNMREEYAEAGPDRVLSTALIEQLTDRLGRREQALVLLNRRGFSTVVFCRQCTQPMECPNCSVSLTVHESGRGGRRARCHYCNYATEVPATCPRCASPYMEQAGYGTERIEAELKVAFPGARVARLDRDAVRRRGATADLLKRFASGAIDVLVGTQMIAKGHDFPNVTLVGVVSADVGLGLADFRAAERTFQLLTQVVGRAGRGERPGHAVIQTLYPEHYSIRFACRQDYPAFLEEELNYRRAMRYPPILAMINGIVRGPTLASALDEAGEIAAELRRSSERHGAFEVVGPAMAPMGRLRGEHRAQFFLKGRQRQAMRDAVRAALAVRPHLRKRVVIDVDPLSVL